MAEVTYSESDLGTGYWQYDFTVYNTSSQIEYPDNNIYNVFLDIGVVAGLSEIINVGLPDGWAYFASPTGTADNPSGYVDSYSLNFGAPPAGTDIAPGTALGGFLFQFNDKLDAISFEALLGNFDPEGNLIGDIFTARGSATPVPESTNLLLLASSLTGLAFFGRKKFNKIE